MRRLATQFDQAQRNFDINVGLSLDITTFACCSGRLYEVLLEKTIVSIKHSSYFPKSLMQRKKKQFFSTNRNSALAQLKAKNNGS